METNYFVCTLGEAINAPGGRPYSDVNHLVDHQAQENPDLPAIGFYRIGGSSKDERTYNHEILTFKHVQQGIRVTAGLLTEQINVEAGQTVGLLSSSSPEFFFVWLGCIRLGHPVLLIAPELAASGIAALCQDCGVEVLLADDKNIKLAEQAATPTCTGQHHRLTAIPVPFAKDTVFDAIKQEAPNPSSHSTAQKSDTAYLHHTSGTSSGIPKAIAQTHGGAVGVLPAFDGRHKATFTTTPLYHGGPADIFRAWTSNAMTWLFPSKDLPIIPSEIVRCLELADSAAKKSLCPPVAYFASVPYILQMMASDSEGIKRLKTMDLVSVGGAALAQDIGDTLVSDGVNLVSRFGSAECGFLLNSHRQYASDQEWQFLRLPRKSSHLRFESNEDGLSELIVLGGWPHLAKTNREDGSYATSDLFEPHPYLENAWRYHSRADSQLTLVTGKKFDPAPLEDAIVAASPLISDALIFGNNKPYPGILLFRSKDAVKMPDDEITREFAPILRKICNEGQAHTRISKNMLVPMEHSESPLEKSSKGTVSRKRAEERYSSRIEAAYSNIEAGNELDSTDDQIPDLVKEIILDASNRPIEPETLNDTTDLFSIGIDSVASIQIRHRLQRLLPATSSRLSPTIVEDCGCIKDLARHIISQRNGEQTSKPQANDQSLMLDLVERYGHRAGETVPIFDAIGVDGAARRLHTVVLTGATGFLGTHVLNLLRKDEAVERVYCLVRGADKNAALERVESVLKHRQFHGLGKDSKITVLQAQLSNKGLGLDESLYKQVAREATSIIHLAWSVNFRMKLSSFEKDIAGVRNLMDLALSSPHDSVPRFAFCSSVASVMAYSGDVVPETMIEDPSASSSIGYSQSKWVAEQVCQRANEKSRLSQRISVFRVGQLSGNSNTGVWNVKEAWPLMLSSVKLTKTLPELQNESLTWLPVNVAAEAIANVSLDSSAMDDLQVLHIVNDSTTPSWDDLLCWMQNLVPFDKVTPEDWVKQLDDLAGQGSDHPALQLLEHWRTAYQEPKETTKRVRFAMEKTEQVSLVMRQLGPVSEEYFGRLWKWIDQNTT